MDRLASLENFLRSICYEKLIEAVREGRNYAILDYQALDRFDPTLSEFLLKTPEEFFKEAGDALNNIDLGEKRKIALRFECVPDGEKVRIKDLRAEHLAKFIKVDGLVRRASEVLPEMEVVIFECPDCGERLEVPQVQQAITYPSECDCGRKRTFKLVDRRLHDARHLFIEDHFESTMGEKPGEIRIYLKDDLTTPKMQKKTDPGARLTITGILKEAPKKIGNLKSKQLEIYLEANHIETKDKDFEELEITPDDEKRILELARDANVYDRLIRSVAPSMFGMDEIKEAIILQLFGGVPQTLPDGTRIRGDIHVLLMGDPAAGKTQILKLISKLVPRGRYVSGKGTSAAGLTATVSKDEEFVGGWVLEAGALVLSNKSVICIDEFDKISKEDLINLHEAMSTQTISIAKATIQATLPAQTAILAGANPKLSRFDPMRSIAEQIDLPDTILSRFDLKFILRDLPNKERDEQMVDHIIKTRMDPEQVKPNIDGDTLKKYIAYARQNCKPQMTRKAATTFKTFFVGLRDVYATRQASSIPITLRQYEALMRLAEASAKIRLADEVTEEDADRAIRLMKFTIKSLGMDPETGEVDIDRAEGGVSSTKRNKIRIVLETIQDLELKLGKTIKMDELMISLQEQGVDETTADSILREMEQSGQLFRPRSNHIQRV